MIVRAAILLMAVLLLTACVAREQQATQSYPKLRATIAKVEAAYPELRTPQEFVVARVSGSNGWPILEEVGRKYKRLSLDECEVYDGEEYLGEWNDLEIQDPAWWHEIEHHEALIDVALRETFELRKEVDRALKCDSLVLTWDDGIDILTVLNAIDMLELRARIQIHRGDFDEAQAEVRRIVEIAWRMDAGWALLGHMLMEGYRKIAVRILLELTAADPKSSQLIDETLQRKATAMPSLEVGFGFELAWMLEQGRAFVAGDSEEEGRGEDSEYWDGVLELTAELLEAVLAANWDLADPRDSRQFLTTMRAILADVKGELEDAKIGWSMQCLRVIYNATRMSCLRPLLLLRKSELAGEKIGTLDELEEKIGLPDGLRLERGEESILIMLDENHPAASRTLSSRDEPIAEYPLLPRK